MTGHIDGKMYKYDISARLDTHVVDIGGMHFGHLTPQKASKSERQRVHV